jgi:hypothetical protein
MDNERYKEQVKDIRDRLQSVKISAELLKDDVNKAEGDSDLYRKLSMYFIPNLAHWLDGLQAGNVRDIENTIEERLSLPRKKK